MKRESEGSAWRRRGPSGVMKRINCKKRRDWEVCEKEEEDVVVFSFLSTHHPSCRRRRQRQSILASALSPD